MRIGTRVGLPPVSLPVWGKAQRADQEVGPCCVPRVTELCVWSFSMTPAIAPTVLEAMRPSSAGEQQHSHIQPRAGNNNNDNNNNNNNNHNNNSKRDRELNSHHGHDGR